MVACNPSKVKERVRVSYAALCKYSTMVSASVCHTEDASSILVTCSNALMAEGIMHRTLNPAIKVRVLVGVLNIGNIARRSSSWLLTNRRGFDSLYSRYTVVIVQ